MSSQATADTEQGHTPRECSSALARAFGFLGKRWNGVLLGTLMHGPAGFAELKRAVDGISDSVLSDRLSELTRAGLVVREVDEGPPLKVSYTLSESGEALVPSLRALQQWGDEHLPAERC
jgi:DNA-binding HxlR family transcriptional regulator